MLSSFMVVTKNVKMEMDEACNRTAQTGGRSLRKVGQLWTSGRDREAVLAIDKEKRYFCFYSPVVWHFRCIQ